MIDKQFATEERVREIIKGELDKEHEREKQRQDRFHAMFLRNFYPKNKEAKG